MNGREAEELNCYCAFCKNPRKIYRKHTVSAVNFLQAVGIVIASSLLFWQKVFEPKALAIGVASLFVIEAAIHIRARASLSCPHCGFDPVLYAKNREAACLKVKNHIEARKSDPDVWLARRAPIRVKKSRGRKGKSTRELVV